MVYLYIPEDDDQPIPIVPLTEEQESAMEDKYFRTLLTKCGVKPPQDEQVKRRTRVLWNVYRELYTDKYFRTLLKKCGVKPPQDEQVYGRTHYMCVMN